MVEWVAPDGIYLQVKDYDGEMLDDVTWCEDKIYEADIEYRRVVDSAVASQTIVVGQEEHK